MGHIVWSVREGKVGGLDALEIMGGFRSANPVHEPKLGEVLVLPDGSGSWRVVDWAVAGRSDVSENVLVVELFGASARPGRDAFVELLQVARV